jgi:hypothetical protein
VTEEKIYKLYLPWGSKVFLFGMLFVFLAVTVLMFVLPLTVTGPHAPPSFIGVFWLLIVGWNLFWILRFPHQIVLHADGTIEFRAVIRKVRMNAIEIASMKPANGTFGFIIVKGKKKVAILSQFDNFHEFVLKLKQLNPSVIIRGC